MSLRFLLLTLFLFLYSSGFSQTDSSVISDPSLPELVELVEEKVPTHLTSFSVEPKNEKGSTFLEIKSEGKNGFHLLNISGEDEELDFKNGMAIFETEFDKSGKLMLFKSGGPDSRKYGDYQLHHFAKRGVDTPRQRNIPLWLSIVPPLVAIFLALIFKEVITSLFVGVWAGAFIAGGMRLDGFYYVFLSVWQVVEKYVLGALNDSGHLSVIVFSLLIGGMVALISKNGGMVGVVNALSKYAKTPRSAQFITWLLGIAIFFDDYANTLIVGNTMRSVTDKFKISREKLAYIVDSTAAPVSAIAFITTWIGAELGYIDGGIQDLAGFDTSLSAYSIFISSLKYSFYPILTLIFILLLIWLKKDFGPMHKAEMRAFRTGQVSSASTKEEDEPDMEDLSPVAGAPKKWQHAVIPVFAVILMTIFGLLDTGMQSCYDTLKENEVDLVGSSWGETWSNMGYLSLSNAETELLSQEPTDEFSEAVTALIGGGTLASAKEKISAQVSSSGVTRKAGILIGKSDSYIALLWASLTGVILALLISVFGKIMTLHEGMHWMTTGFKTMLPAIIILTLAWSLAICTEELHTANFLTSVLDGQISPYMMPPVIFVLAALISFSTGSSWSTMAILYPIAIPTTWVICNSAGLDPGLSMEILLNVIATVLAASVLGDHCSPISDTTILSSLASDCNHIDHVKTQLPYALIVGVVSLLCGFLVTLLGGGLLLSLLLLAISVTFFFFLIRGIGKERG